MTDEVRAMETIEGIYRNGRVELSKQPRNADNTRVVVTFTQVPATPFDTSVAPAAASAITPGVSHPLPAGPERDVAVEELLAEMEAGIDFGGAPSLGREEIYNERADELERRRRQNS